MMGDDELSDTIADMEPVQEEEPPGVTGRAEPDITFTERARMQEEALAEKRGEKLPPKRKREGKGSRGAKSLAFLVVLAGVGAFAFNAFLNLGASDKLDEACHHIPKNLEGLYETSLMDAILDGKAKRTGELVGEGLDKWCTTAQARARPLTWNLGLTVPKPEGMDAIESEVLEIMKGSAIRCHDNLTSWIERQVGVRGKQTSTMARQFCGAFKDTVDPDRVMRIQQTNLWLLAEELNQLHLQIRAAKANVEAQRKMFGIK